MINRIKRFLKSQKIAIACSLLLKGSVNIVHEFYHRMKGGMFWVKAKLLTRKEFVQFKKFRKSCAHKLFKEFWKATN